MVPLVALVACHPCGRGRGSGPCNFDCPPGSANLGTEGTCFPVDSGTWSTAVGNQVDLASYPPVVVSSEPAAGALGVDPALDTVRVTFSRPMDPGGWSWVSTDDAFPPSTDAGWEDERTNALQGVTLAADTAYHVWINDPYGTYEAFSADGRPALAWSLAFSTGTDPSALAPFPPVVVSTVPASGSDGVDPALGSLTIRFSKELVPDGGWVRADDPETDPGAGEPSFDGTATEAQVPVTLRPNTTYALWIDRNGRRLLDTDGLPVPPYLLTFRTGGP